MTKVITYNNIQLSFQADTSGIKASKAELGALTREVNAQRTPLEKFMRQLQVINEASAKMAPKDVDDRLRAITNRFIDAEGAAGNYTKALYAVSQLVPKLAGEMDRLAYETQKAEIAQKEFANTEQNRIAQQKLQDQKKAGLDSLKKQQQEDKRLQVERQVTVFLANQKAAQQRLREEADAHNKLIEHQLDIRKKLEKAERDEYVNSHLKLEAEKALLAQKQRRVQIEDMLARIGARQAGINLPAGSSMTQKQIADLTEKIAKHRKDTAASEQKAAVHLSEISKLYQQIQDYNYSLLSTDQKRLSSIQAFSKAEQARAQLIVNNLNQEATLLNTTANPQLISQAWNNAKLKIDEYTKYLIQVEHIQTRLNLQSERQKGSVQAIVDLEKNLAQLKLSQLPAAHQAYKTQQILIADMQKQEESRARKLVAIYKEEQLLAGKPIDRNRIAAIFADAGRSVQKFVQLLKQVEVEERKIEQAALAVAAAENAALEAVRQQERAEARRHQRRRERMAENARLAETARRDLISGAMMGGMPGGMLLGMSRTALGGFAVAGGIAASLKAYSDMRDKLVVLEAQFKSTAIAAQIFGDIRRLAAQSPLETNELMKAAVVLSQYGFAASEIVPTLRQLTAISTGNAARMEGLARAFAQVKAAGRLMGQEVLQFTNSGFSPLNEMARVTGIEMSRLKKLMEEGKISFQDVADALKSATSEGGAFFGQTEKQAQELSARFNELGDSVKQLGEAFGELFSEPAKQTMSFLSHGFKMMAAGGKFTASLITDLFNSEFHKLDELARKQRNLQRRMDLDARIHDIYAQMAGLDVGGIAEKDGKLFENLKQQDKAMEAKKQAEKMEAIVKKQRKIEEFDDTSKIKKLEDEIAKSTMTKFQYAQREAKIRLDEITREANERLSLEIELDKLRGSTGERHAKLIEEQTRITENKIAAAKRDLERLPFLDAASKINEEERKKFLKENPQVKVMQQAKQIADMIRLNMINQDAGARALAEVMMENTEATKQQSQELPKTIQAGTVEAYQAMFGRDNTAKLQLAEQKKQVTKQAEANKLLEKIASKPGMKKV